VRLTKHTHATVTVEDQGHRVLIDPGAFTPEARDLLADATEVLITHDHVDHLDVEAVRTALAQRPALRVWGPPAVAAALSADADGRVGVVTGGEELDLGGIGVRVVGGPHASVHRSIPLPDHVGYLVGGAVYHPGDAYRLPGRPVDTLLVPVSGPWTRVGDAMDFVAAVAPRQSVLVHDVMLSDVGRSSSAAFLRADAAGGAPVVVLAPGESLDI